MSYLTLTIHMMNLPNFIWGLFSLLSSICFLRFLGIHGVKINRNNFRGWFRDFWVQIRENHLICNFAHINSKKCVIYLSWKYYPQKNYLQTKCVIPSHMSFPECGREWRPHTLVIRILIPYVTHYNLWGLITIAAIISHSTK